MESPPLARFFDRLRQTAHLGGLSTLLVCFKSVSYTHLMCIRDSLKQHPNYKYTAEYDKKKNAFHLESLFRHLSLIHI